MRFNITKPAILNAAWKLGNAISGLTAAFRGVSGTDDLAHKFNMGSRNGYACGYYAGMCMKHIPEFAR